MDISSNFFCHSFSSLKFTCWWVKILVVIFILSLEIQFSTATSVQLFVQEHHVVIDNGIVQLTISYPNGSVTGIQYNNISNLLEENNHPNDRGYWDLVWNYPGTFKKKPTKGKVDRIEATEFNVIVENETQVEVSFKRNYNSSLGGLPVNIDKRYIMLSNCSGFYTYAIFERLEGFPGVDIDNIRMVFKLTKDKFTYMAISDRRQRYMPSPDDRGPGRGRALAYPEAVLLVDPIEPQFKGEVDDKYEYAAETKDIKVHGWISSDPSVGFWHITPSNEFRSAGPFKQVLTSHVGPDNLAIFHSVHYSGKELIIKFKDGEVWNKVFGPVFVYLNSFPVNDTAALWIDAKNQMMYQTEKWPYDFPASKDFPASDQRGTVRGRLYVQDRFVSSGCKPANNSYVGLAPIGDAGSWQRETKGYQFWRQADSHGNFFISDIREGQYNLYASVPGVLGDYRYDTIINVTAGSDICVGELVYRPPRYGSTIWEIGVPDRSAAEFYIPNPNPNYINRLYLNSSSNRFRQYGLWERYTELYPNEDLVYNVGVDDYRKDWFFAQVPRKKENNTYQGTTWQIKFKLNYIDLKGTFKLVIALATQHAADLQVRINDPSGDPLFSSGEIGYDNTIARHGIHGLYRNYTVDINGDLLFGGNNTIYLTQPLSVSPFQGLMYDYIRLEVPPSSPIYYPHHKRHKKHKRHKHKLMSSKHS